MGNITTFCPRSSVRMQTQSGALHSGTSTKIDGPSPVKFSEGVYSLPLSISKRSTLNCFCETAASLDRVKGSLWGIYIGDALAMPTHWYYDQSHLKRTYGQITGYVAPQDKLPGSIMSLSNTGGGGRGSNSGDIVGGVILHGKKKYWERGANWFYHRGLAAGLQHPSTGCRNLLFSILFESIRFAGAALHSVGPLMRAGRREHARGHHHSPYHQKPRRSQRVRAARSFQPLHLPSTFAPAIPCRSAPSRRPRRPRRRSF